ncbi:hypothetical protein [Rhodoferax sp. BAB1]|uniref:hypothetical protein n=1 Tax=Rhodoferax sp. BAB1 TaxID=2741720 RepID=UPI0015756D5D|nr:hypothetical protein [Rhodoferax sp. BAB1]QKO22336.1 hypothetical protein HTY51_10755 [Rhodoferax sp. BAB1]
MEQATLLKIAKLRTLAARHGKSFDVVQFAANRTFARETLSALMDTADPDLLVAGLELMDALGMTASSEGTRPALLAADPKTKAEAPKTDARYVGRLR